MSNIARTQSSAVVSSVCNSLYTQLYILVYDVLIYYLRDVDNANNVLHEDEVIVMAVFTWETQILLK